MPIESMDLLKEYYKHLQHTEKQRSSFFQIYLAISGAGVIGFERNGVPTTIKIFLSVLMIFITILGWEIMRKSSEVVDVYTQSIVDILCVESPDYCIMKHLPHDIQNSKSGAYNNIFVFLIIFYVVLTFHYFV